VPLEPVLALTAVQLAAAIANREISSREAVGAHLARIEAVNPELRAVVQLRREEGALRDAAAADEALARGDASGPLHGVPFTVKDWIETNDLPCAANVEERRDYLPRHDATVVARLRAAGAILVGKTKPGLDDAVYPRARNPIDHSRSAGGSSGGEAAIVAAHGSPFGLGSDSGGSLRWPAHCCGVATIRPTAGRVPNTGHFPRINPTADPRTVIGPITRSVKDLEIVLRIISGPDGIDTAVHPVPLQAVATVDPASLRVAAFTNFPGAVPSAATVRAVEATAAALAAAGARVVRATPPRLEESLPLTQAYWRRPESSSWSEWIPGFRSTLSADDVERSLFEWDRFRRSMLAFMRDVDVIVCPVAVDAAPPFDAAVPVETWLYMLPFSLTGYPVVTLPAGRSDEGLPVGVQVAARPWEDHVALAAAAVVEAANLM
jgi:amidase